MAILAFLVRPSRYPPAIAEPILTASLMLSSSLGSPWAPTCVPRTWLGRGLVSCLRVGCRSPAPRRPLLLRRFDLRLSQEAVDWERPDVLHGCCGTQCVANLADGLVEQVQP